MGRGGFRVGAGRPKGATDFKGKTKSRIFIEQRMNELAQRNTESAKQEACRLAVQLLPYDEPRLSAVTAQVESVTYVARIPTPILDIDEWQKQTNQLLIRQK
jgi:hypothetical protein